MNNELDMVSYILGKSSSKRGGSLPKGPGGAGEHAVQAMGIYVSDSYKLSLNVQLTIANEEPPAGLSP